MDIVLICREGETNSVLTNTAVAMDAVQSGKTAAVLFTEDALAGLAGRAFGWAPALNDRGARSLVSRGATALGYPVANEKDTRSTDVLRLLRAASAAGVKLWGCPLWGRILGVDGGGAPAGGSGGRPGESSFSVVPLPSEITTLTKAQLLTELQAAKTVVGGF